MWTRVEARAAGGDLDAQGERVFRRGREVIQKVGQNAALPRKEG